MVAGFTPGSAFDDHGFHKVGNITLLNRFIVPFAVRDHYLLYIGNIKGSDEKVRQKERLAVCRCP